MMMSPITACLHHEVGRRACNMDATSSVPRMTRARARAALQRSCHCVQAYGALLLLNPHLVHSLLPCVSSKCARLRRTVSPSPPSSSPHLRLHFCLGLSLSLAFFISHTGRSRQFCAHLISVAHSFPSSSNIPSPFPFSSSDL